jgi:hypothetical protein
MPNARIDWKQRSVGGTDDYQDTDGEAFTSPTDGDTYWSYESQTGTYKTFFVDSVNGDDTNSGEEPSTAVATVAQAGVLAAASPATYVTIEVLSGEDPADVIEAYILHGLTVPAGTYETESPIVMTDGQTLKLATGATIRAAHTGTMITGSGSVTITGGVIDGGELLEDWVDEGDETWSHVYTSTNKLRDLWSGGTRRTVSRYPETGFIDSYTLGALESGNYYEVQLDDAGLKSVLPAAPTDVELHHLKTYQHNGGTVTTITDDGGDLTTVRQQSAMFVFVDNLTECQFWLQNAPEFLTTGTWCHDRGNNRILYKPLPGEQVATFSASVPKATALLNIAGSAGSLATVSVSNTTFQHGYHSFADSNRIYGIQLVSQASIVLEQYVKQAVFDNVLFRNLGEGFRIGKTGGKVTGHFRGCRFQGFAGRSMYMGQYIGADSTSYSEMDLTDCIWDDIGAVYLDSYAVQIVRWNNATMSGCVIRNSSGGISIGTGGETTYPIGCTISTSRFQNLQTYNSDGGAIYARSSQGLTIDDCYFHDNDDGTYLSSLELKPGVYFESTSKDVTVQDCLFNNAENWHLFESSESRGNLITGCRLEKPPNNSTFAAQENRGWNPSGDKTWYEANHTSTWNITLVGDPVAQSDGSDQITFSTRTFLAAAYLVGKFVYFVDGPEQGNFYRIAAYTSTTLDLVDPLTSGSVELTAVSGNFCVVVPSYNSGNEFSTESEMDALVATWLASNPAPTTP